MIIVGFVVRDVPRRLRRRPVHPHERVALVVAVQLRQVELANLGKQHAVQVRPADEKHGRTILRRVRGSKRVQVHDLQVFRASVRVELDRLGVEGEHDAATVLSGQRAFVDGEREERVGAHHHGGRLCQGSKPTQILRMVPRKGSVLTNPSFPVYRKNSLHNDDDVYCVVSIL